MIGTAIGIGVASVSAAALEIAEGISAGKASQAAATAGRTAESAGSTAVREGIYEAADATAPGRTYVGQSGNVPARLSQHEASGKFPPGTKVSTTGVRGGKTAREIAEHKRINELGGTRSNPGSQTSNQRKPIGPKREHLLKDK